LESSCADLIRASASLFRAAEGVDGRVKPGQDETREPISFLLPPQDFPRTALRTAGEGGPSPDGSAQSAARGQAPGLVGEDR
jgi:hypothetical protein